MTPRVGDLVQTRDGHLHHVTRITRHELDADLDTAHLSRLGDHIETAALLTDVTVREDTR